MALSLNALVQLERPTSLEAEMHGHFQFWLILVAFILVVWGGGWLLKKLGGGV